jgi:hypothetical protein
MLAVQPVRLGRGDEELGPVGPRPRVGHAHHTRSCKLKAVLRIRILMFLGLPDPDPDPLVRGMDPDPDLDLSLSKYSKKNLDLYSFVTSF